MFYELSPPARKKNRNFPLLSGLDKQIKKGCRFLEWLQENASIYVLFRKVRKRYTAFELHHPLKNKCVSSKKEKMPRKKAARRGSNFHHRQWLNKASSQVMSEEQNKNQAVKHSRAHGEGSTSSTAVWRSPVYRTLIRQ